MGLLETWLYMNKTGEQKWQHMLSEMPESERRYMQRYDEYILTINRTLLPDEFKQLLERYFPDRKDHAEYPKDEKGWGEAYGMYLDMKRMRDQMVRKKTSDPLKLRR